MNLELDCLYRGDDERISKRVLSTVGLFGEPIDLRVEKFTPEPVPSRANRR